MGTKTPLLKKKVLIHVRHLIAGKKKAIKLSVFLFQHIFELRVEGGKKTLLIFCLDEGTQEQMLSLLKQVVHWSFLSK